jgi:hypothetical protein
MTRDRPLHGWPAVLRREPARIVEGPAEGGYTGAFEIACCDCGDRPGVDYSGVPPGLQRICGPYPVADGVAAYERHVELCQQPGRRRWLGLVADAGYRR